MTTTTHRPKTHTQTLTIVLPPLPSLAAPLAVAEQAAIATTSAVAAALAAPAAATTLRAISITGVVDTAERCQLTEEDKEKRDKFANSDRQFPESFFPFIKITYGDPKMNSRFALPSRRGAVLGNTLAGPLLVFLFTCLVGFIRTRISSKFKAAGVFAGGRTPSLVAAVTGSLAMDGIFASAMVLLTVPGGPNGADAALAVLGVIISTTIVIIPGVLLKRELDAARDTKNPIECVPAVLRSNDNPTGDTPAGMYWFFFGDEIWTGEMRVMEQFRSLFAACKGMSREYALKFTTTQRVIRFLSTWSFYLHIAFTAVAAVGRGWATTQPCIANGKVQLMQFIISVFAFLFSAVVQPPISPMRRAADIIAGFLLMLSTFVLSVLGSEAGTLVGRCALGAAFLATGSTMCLFLGRTIYLPLKGLQLSPASARHDALEINTDIDLADLLIALPMMDDSQVARGGTGADNRGRLYNNDLFETSEMDEILNFTNDSNGTVLKEIKSPKHTHARNNNDDDMREFLLSGAEYTQSGGSGSVWDEIPAQQATNNTNNHNNDDVDDVFANLDPITNNTNNNNAAVDDLDSYFALKNDNNNNNGKAGDDIWNNFDQE